MDIDIIDIVTVDDKSSSDANERVAVSVQLHLNHILNLPQLKSEQTRLVVGLHKITVVAVRRDEHNLVGGNAHQVGGSGYDQKLPRHDAAKIRTCRRCKDTKSGEMYEMVGKMYEEHETNTQHTVNVVIPESLSCLFIYEMLSNDSSFCH